uniref:cytochrome c oxidase subunit III n=1 Tax=Gymnopraia lapislazula TaxID=316224 RepID=UPI0026E42367|nr:cytochrome c oxidase subunit III [Gymnopraia lapislazula]WJJ70116.1 cytochrome c oxidase subunit 3 [Gymnopraia lapislazula]
MIIKSTPFHIPNFSPWPILLSIWIFNLFVGIILYLHYNIIIIIILSSILVVDILKHWFNDIIIESLYQGHHTLKVQKLLKFAFLLFIISEIMLFFSFFWSFFHFSLVPNIHLGNNWPPLYITPINPFGIPLFNTIILISSGITLTISHFYLISNNNLSIVYLNITICFGILFSLLQLFEYYNNPITIACSVYGSLFYLLTGFHGFHVIVGTIFLIVCSYRLINHHFTNNHHVLIEVSSWYWHFVDIVWLFLYIILYIWI